MVIVKCCLSVPMDHTHTSWISEQTEEENGEERRGKAEGKGGEKVLYTAFSFDFPSQPNKQFI